MTLKLAFLFIVLFCKETKCACRKSFVTFCDDLEDLKALNEFRVANWTDLIVGDENADSSKLKTVGDFFLPSILLRFRKLMNLAVVRQIKDMKSTAFTLNSDERELEHLNLYGNEIRRIKSGIFRSLKVNRLSLVNNSIEYIHEGAFEDCKIKTIDLSDNKLEVIEEGVFSASSVTETEEIILTNNNLKVIEPHSLPYSLQVLNLNHNDIARFSYDFFDSYTNLRVLTFSHNKIQIYLPKINNLTKIVVIDASHNSIQGLEKIDFDKLTKLEVLDLSHNNIYNPLVLSKIQVPERFPPLQISLAFNNLKHLIIDDGSFQNCIPLLYGNPWQCKCWEMLEKYLFEKNIERNQCDLKLFRNEHIPYCAQHSNVTCMVNRDYLEKGNDVSIFVEKAEKGESVVGCRLAPRIL